MGVAVVTFSSMKCLWNQSSRLALIASLAAIAAPALAQSVPTLAPLTKLQLSVVQWNPVLGQYQKLDAVSGELTVSPDGTVTVPLVGKLSVRDEDADKLASIIADRIKAKIGLVDVPEVTVEVSAYPPIYVIGDVTTAGEFPYRPGMTVLQALALGGGQLRANVQQDSERTKLLGQLQGGDADLLRSMAHIARFQAELSGAQSIVFPAELASAPAGSQIAQIIAQEEQVFRSRIDAAKRQVDSFEELRTLLLSEIDVLQQKATNLDTAIASKEKEFSGVKTLVDQGIATVTRRTDLETALTSMRSDRLDNMTATMRARQALSEAQRNLAAVQDQQKTDASSQLQAEQAKLEELRNTLATARLLLMGLPAETATRDARPPLAYTIIRHQQDGSSVEQVQADETTQMVPGDVLKVIAPVQPEIADTATASADSAL